MLVIALCLLFLIKHILLKVVEGLLLSEKIRVYSKVNILLFTFLINKNRLNIWELIAWSRFFVRSLQAYF